VVQLPLLLLLEPLFDCIATLHCCPLLACSMEMAVRLCGKSRLGYVHLGESHRGYMGSGSVNFSGLFRGLADIGYTGRVLLLLLLLLLLQLLLLRLCVLSNGSVNFSGLFRGLADIGYTGELYPLLLLLLLLLQQQRLVPALMICALLMRHICALLTWLAYTQHSRQHVREDIMIHSTF
jgi:hypothetical protein